MRFVFFEKKKKKRNNFIIELNWEREKVNKTIPKVTKLLIDLFTSKRVYPIFIYYSFWDFNRFQEF